MSLSSALALRVFVLFAAAYFMSYALRTVQAAIAPLLTADLRLASGDLGLLSAAYLLAFAAMQIPLGWWLDRYGSRRVESLLLVVAAAGCMVFAGSASLTGLFTGRAMIGVGVSACLMAAYTFYRRWMPLERQGQLAAMMLMAGTAGALAATLPVTWLAGAVGWRGVFVLCAAVFGVLAAALFWGVPRHTDPAPHAAPTGAQGGYRAVFAHPSMVQVLPLAALTQGGWLALQSLWLGPWMHRVLGLDPDATSSALFAFNLAVLLAYLTLSIVTARRPGMRLERFFLPGLCYLAVLLPVAIAWTAVESRWLWACLAFGMPAAAMLQTHAGLQFPKELAGRAFTAFNLALFVGAFAVQWGLGIAIDLLLGAGLAAVAAHQAAFGLLWALQVAALAWYWLRRGSVPQR